MATRIEAYVDTSALIAFADSSDTHHALFLRLFGDPPPLVTTTLVVAEGHGWFLRRFDSSRALLFLAMIEAMAPLEVVGGGDARAGGGYRPAAAVLRSIPDDDGRSRAACHGLAKHPKLLVNRLPSRSHRYPAHHSPVLTASDREIDIAPGSPEPRLAANSNEQLSSPRYGGSGTRRPCCPAGLDSVVETDACDDPGKGADPAGGHAVGGRGRGLSCRSFPRRFSRSDESCGPGPPPRRTAPRSSVPSPPPPRAGSCLGRARSWRRRPRCRSRCAD